MNAEMDGGVPGEASTQRQRQRLRIFDTRMREACWDKADVVPGRHPERWRKDIAGNVVCKKFSGGCQGCLCYEYDHITPFSKGGKTEADNCQILQTRVNRGKGNVDVSEEEMRRFSCDVKFTETEMDVIEMAVYGNVERPGLQCRCKSVAEAMNLSFVKAKYRDQLACELPYARESADAPK